MNSSDLHFDSDGRLLQVCVAKWMDGTQVWRDTLKGSEDEVVFEFRHRNSDLSTSYIISQIGLFPSFSVKGGRFYSMPGIRKEWADMAPYIRWFSSELGFFPWPSTPMSNGISESDPFVAWFADIGAALSDARILDGKLSRVKAVLDGTLPSSTSFWRPSDMTIKKAAEEIGEDSDLVEQICHFVDSLLEPAWVSPDWSKLVGRGLLSFSVRRPNHSHSGGVVGRKRHPEVHYSDLLKYVEAPSLVDLIAILLKKTSGSAVLIFRDRGDADDWFRGHSIKGELIISEEEVEVFRILDEAIPYYLLPNDEFSAWAMGRLGS